MASPSFSHYLELSTWLPGSTTSGFSQTLQEKEEMEISVFSNLIKEKSSIISFMSHSLVIRSESPNPALRLAGYQEVEIPGRDFQRACHTNVYAGKPVGRNPRLWHSRI